jgi:hypothetical protein
MIRSVAEDLRHERRRVEAAMTPSERVRLAIELAERDLAVYCGANGVSREQALRTLRAQAQHGRTPSRVMSE